MDEPPGASPDIQHENRHAVPLGWIDEFEGSREAVLLADYELLTQVMWESFAGPAWDKMSARLVAYGLVVMKSWLRRGVIFAKCTEKGWGIPNGMHAGIDDEDERDALAAETVWRAVLAYRDKVLIPGRWDPRKGANLTTYFTGQCLLQFRNVYRDWHRDTYGYKGAHKLNKPLTAQTPELALDRSTHPLSPDQQAVNRGRIREGLDNADSTDREILGLYAEGYTYDEIETLTGVDKNTIKSRMHRLRKKAAPIHDAA